MVFLSTCSQLFEPCNNNENKEVAMYIANEAPVKCKHNETMLYRAQCGLMCRAVYFVISGILGHLNTSCGSICDLVSCKISDAMMKKLL